ncbi:DUF2878 domain-containing protein [Haliea sp. E17]|uniref:DUF2878 domain-containing protein n=1 Tax=Haliea sp. E17 TaxID=3401576 RepID=UPI003AB04C3F
MWRNLVNGLLFNVIWFAVIASQSALLAWPLVIFYVAAHLIWLGRGRAELALILSLAGFGLVLDQCLFFSGLLIRPGAGGTAPLWLSALWPLFATTLMHAFSGLARAPLVAAVLGAVAGYGSYRLGAAMTDISFGQSPLTDIALTVLWALLFPALLLIAARLAGAQPGGRSSYAS